MSSKRLIIFLLVMRSQEKISYVKMLCICRINMVNSTLILFQIPIFCQKSIMIFIVNLKNKVKKTIEIINEL